MARTFLKKIIPSFLLDFYHLFLAMSGAFLYLFPSRNMKVVGVTGTNGKSTVVLLSCAVLEKAGYKVASISSIKFKIGQKEYSNDLKMTMPGRFKLQRFLRQAVKEGCEYVVLEVTSEGIKQHRHRFVDFDAAIFTNLTPEHIESHGSFEKYKKAKGRLFKAAKKVHIINIDDRSSGYFLDFPAKKKYTYGLRQGNINNENLRLDLSLPGQFNIYNGLAAVCLGVSQGIDLQLCKKAVQEIKQIPGRMETVVSEPFKVVIDYAHTPDSLRKAYKALPGNKICVLGACGGGRDKWKRPELGRIAGENCRRIILADEDPYDETPREIIADVKSGISDLSKVLEIQDRRKAIRKALEEAGKGDTVVITGKGSEPWMCLAGGEKMPWNEKEVVLQELEKIH